MIETFFCAIDHGAICLASCYRLLYKHADRQLITHHADVTRATFHNRTAATDSKAGFPAKATNVRNVRIASASQ